MSISFRWQKIDGCNIPIPYDSNQHAILTEFMDYAIYLDRHDNLSHQYIKNELFHLSLFEKHLQKIEVRFIDATSIELRSFRDNDLERLRLNSKSSLKSVKAVVNLRLRRIYHFYTWLQTQTSSNLIIGRHDCQIYSSLPEYSEGRKLDSNDKDIYPLCFRRIGSSSKHTTRYEASVQDKVALEKIFMEHHNTYIGQRNSLILEIANLTGFRRSSINSLLCKQFSDEILARASDDFILAIPPHQKFGYTLSFKIPILLAYRINSFINTFRKQLIESKGIRTHETQDRIFLSAKTAKPLNNQTISEIFHDALENLQITQPRVGLHTFRRKFTNDRITEEILTRAELGLDSSTESIELSVSLQLGQTSSSSIRPYVSRRQTLEIEKARALKAHSRESLREENENLRNEIIKLRSEISGLKNKLGHSSDVSFEVAE